MNRSRQTNVCIQLTEFDLAAPHGAVAKGIVVAHPYLEGEMVSVRLQSPEEALAEGGFRAKRTKADNDKFFARRTTLEKFSAGYKVGRNENPPMEPGSMILFHGCVKDFDASAQSDMPVWKSQYAEHYGHGNVRSIEHGAGRVRVATNSNSGRTMASLDLLRTGPEDVRFVTSLQEMKAFYEQEMDPVMASVGEGEAMRSPIALIRLIGDDGRVTTSFAYAETLRTEIDAGDGTKKFTYGKADFETSFKAAFVEGKQAGGRLQLLGAALDDGLMGVLDERKKHLAMSMRSQLDSGSLRIEVIPGQSVKILGATLENLLDEKKQLNRNYNQTFVKIQKADGSEDFVPGFQRMTVGMMLGKPFNGQPADVILTTFVNDEFARARTAENIGTPLFTPGFTQARQADAEAKAEQAAKVGGVDLGHDAAPEEPAQANESSYEAEPEPF